MKEDLEKLIRECKAFCDKYDKEYVTVHAFNREDQKNGCASVLLGYEHYDTVFLEFDEEEIEVI